MIRKFFFAFAIFSLAVVISLSGYVFNGTGTMNPVFSKNVEALAGAESGGSKCYRRITSDPSEQCMYCGTCSILPGRGADKSACY